VLRLLIEARALVALTIAAATGLWGTQTYPVSRDDAFLGLIAERAPDMYSVLAHGYATLWFITPFFAASLLMSFVTIVAYRRAPSARVRSLPPYPYPEVREKLTLVLGETHFHTLPGRAPAPNWLAIPQRGLYTGIMILGAVGTGKTSACMYDMAIMLRRAVDARQNILISGGTGTGKTTLLNAVAQMIPADDRIVLIEETSEILIDKPNLVRFEARRAQAPLGQEDPMPAVTIADLVRATLRHRPDRILVGEVRGPEAFDLLQALNTGHLGSLTTIHANNAEQALTRLAHCVLTANVGLPHRSTREAITLAIHLVVHLARVERKRVVTEIARVRGYDPHQDRFIVEPWLPESAIEEGTTL